MATVIMDVEFPPTSTFEDKSTPAGKIWFRTLQIIALESDCRDLLYWGRWIDAPDKVSVIIGKVVELTT